MLSLATNLGMPSLSAPFVLTVWLIHAALRPDVSAWWSRFWLSVPSCPEDSLVAGRLAASRGLAPGSIGLVPPFDGIMTVAQGMDGDLTHCGPWRYALDFIKTENSYSYRNTGYALNDYMAFAHSVLSPAKGIIAACRNDIADNAPGTLNLIENWGNHILIDIGDNLFVLLAHLQQGSLQVECGTAVSVGTPLARFGNSGRSSQPHLHLHVQRGSQLGAPTVPMHLGSCILDGNHYALDAHPVSGQTISVATPRKTLLNACAPSHGRVWNFTTAGSSWQLEAKIGLFGTIHLNSGCGGSIEAFVGADMLALYHRTGSADPALDAFALAFGLTPYAADARKWTDAPDAALLPLSFGQRLGVTLRHPFGANLDSHYERHWDAGRGLWCQSGHHSLTRIFGVINTESTAWLSESLGIVAFSLAIDGHILIDAHLARCGNVGDHGIPAWQVSCLHIATS
jgi:murein DD-endopeptidase MepM/ murein hydrolase activator NlpD